MTGTSEKTSLEMPDLLESKLPLLKMRVFKVLPFNNCYANLIPLHDPSQNLGANIIQMEQAVSSIFDTRNALKDFHKLRMGQSQAHLFGLYLVFERPLHNMVHLRKFDCLFLPTLKRLQKPDLDE